MASVYDRNSPYITKGSFSWQYGVRRDRRDGLTQRGRKEGCCLRKHGTLYFVLSFLSSVTLSSPLLSLMTSFDVRLQVSLREITPPTSRDSIATSAY